MDVHLYYLSSLQFLRSSPPKVLRKLHLVTSTEGKILSAFQQSNSKMPLVTSPQIYLLSAALRPPQPLIPTSSPSTSAPSMATPLRGTSHAQPPRARRARPQRTKHTGTHLHRPQHLSNHPRGALRKRNRPALQDREDLQHVPLRLM